MFKNRIDILRTFFFKGTKFQIWGSINLFNWSEFEAKQQTLSILHNSQFLINVILFLISLNSAL